MMLPLCLTDSEQGGRRPLSADAFEYVQVAQAGNSNVSCVRFDIQSSDSDQLSILKCAASSSPGLWKRFVCVSHSVVNFSMKRKPAL
jgi:hypothetical protein